MTWSGRHRTPLKDMGVYPRPERTIPLWIAVGGSPQSMIRAGTLGLPMALAIIGGEPERFVPLVDLYREAAVRAGHDPIPSVSINSHGWIADDSQQAADECYPSFAETMNRIGRERGFPQLTRSRFEADRGPRGSQLVGSPQQVIEKILFEHELFGNDRFLLQMTVGAMPHAKVLHAIELLGTVVAPAVRKATAT